MTTTIFQSNAFVHGQFTLGKHPVTSSHCKRLRAYSGKAKLGIYRISDASRVGLRLNILKICWLKPIGFALWRSIDPRTPGKVKLIRALIGRLILYLIGYVFVTWAVSCTLLHLRSRKMHLLSREIPMVRMVRIG